ncbi:hypothetical protein GCM10023196_037290 [Actinoallomurus vinaceus]|uniref:HTH merR-type domain-containing protein n=1 Tax=Actinoallomurus vinaceus TaxID=1080074 RepID=A0ABP8UAU2_9ACTN
MRCKLIANEHNYALGPVPGRGHSHVQGVIAMVGPDGEDYWTTKQAADEMEVAPSTISGWRRKGYLDPVPGSPQRRPLYRRADVAAAEKQAHDAAVRTSGSFKRTSRVL